jgi:hypothetical protein
LPPLGFRLVEAVAEITDCRLVRRYQRVFLPDQGGS